MLTLWYLILGWKEYNKPFIKKEQIDAKLEEDKLPKRSADIDKTDTTSPSPLNSGRNASPSIQTPKKNYGGPDFSLAPDAPTPSLPKDIPKPSDSQKSSFPSKVFDSPTTPELPKIPKTPEKPNMPDLPKLSPLTPKTPESPKIPEPIKPAFGTPKTPDSPKLAPSLPEMPKTTPKTPDSPKFPEMPKTSPKVPELPKFSPRTQDSSKLPELPKTPPRTHDSPKFPQSAKVPDTPPGTIPSKRPESVMPNFPASGRNLTSGSNQEFSMPPYLPGTPGNKKPESRDEELFSMGSNFRRQDSTNDRKPLADLKDLSYAKGELPADPLENTGKKLQLNTRAPKYLQEVVVSNPDSLRSSEEEDEGEDED